MEMHRKIKRRENNNNFPNTIGSHKKKKFIQISQLPTLFRISTENIVVGLKFK